MIYSPARFFAGLSEATDRTIIQIVRRVRVRAARNGKMKFKGEISIFTE